MLSAASTAMPEGLVSPVFEPVMVWIGLTLPFAPAAKTTIPVAFRTYAFPAESRAMPRGDASRVFDPEFSE